MKYILLHALLMFFVCFTSCRNGVKTEPATKKAPGPESKSAPVPGEKYHTRYEYSDGTGKSLIILNSFPRAQIYTDAGGKEFAKGIFWTRIINQTDVPLDLMIDFPEDPYEFPGSVGSSVNILYKLILPSDTMTNAKEDLYDYGLTGIDSIIKNGIDKPSSLRKTVYPDQSIAFYVVRLGLKPLSGWPDVKPDGNIHKDQDYGTTRAGFSLKGQDLFYTLNGKEIPCGKINLKNLILKTRL